jgi:endonuclease/exonuclease/phosphatase family metal-dependent hydrolase
MSFNVRGAFHTGDGINAWDNRSVLNVETIKHHAPDLIGFQELQSGNLHTYRERLPKYQYILGLKAGNEAPHEFNAIFFDPKRLEVLNSGGFWLSTTAERYSASWQTRCIRCANWAILRCLNTGLSLLHLNTHLDHVSKAARAEGSKLILRKIAEIQKGQENDYLAIITGDFNCVPGSSTYRSFIEDGFVDTYLVADDFKDTEGAFTFHAFRGTRYSAGHHSHQPGRIDWILLRDRPQLIRIKSQLILRDCDEESGIYPSDHYPVLAEFVLSV